MMKLERLAVSCGGTGGHFYPGLSVARELNAAGGRALLILGGKNAPGQAEIARGFGVQTLQVAALPLSKNPLKLFRFLLAFLRGAASASARSGSSNRRLCSAWEVLPRCRPPWRRNQ